MSKETNMAFNADDFQNIDRNGAIGAGAESNRPSLTYFQDVWRRLRKNIPALAGFIIIIILIFTAIFGPMMTQYTYSDQNLNFVSIPPRMEILKIDDETFVYVHPTLRLFSVSEKGELIEPLPAGKNDFTEKDMIFEINGREVVIDYDAEPMVMYDNEGRVIEPYDKVWNKTYLLGSDHLGRDLLTRVIFGARISLIIGFVASLVNLTVGVFYGGLAGYFGGMIDNMMMRLVDTLRSIPRLLYVIIIMVIIGSGLKSVVLTIGLVYWLGMARIVRGQVLSLKNHEFVMAAKTMGANTWRILRKHLIPNALGPIIVVTAMNIPGAIFTEAFLSFVGLGVNAPQASWGTLCNEAIAGFQRYPYQLLFPALAICLTVLAFNFVGDGLRDSLDPRLRK